jgi:hypothetical protein
MHMHTQSPCAVLIMLITGCAHRQIREVMCEADENDDGVIEYKEFVPFMVDIIQGMQVRVTKRASPCAWWCTRGDERVVMRW